MNSIPTRAVCPVCRQRFTDVVGVKGVPHLRCGRCNLTTPQEPMMAIGKKALEYEEGVLRDVKAMFRKIDAKGVVRLEGGAEIEF